MSNVSGKSCAVTTTLSTRRSQAFQDKPRTWWAASRYNNQEDWVDLFQVRALLVVDPAGRLSARQCLDHWSVFSKLLAPTGALEALFRYYKTWSSRQLFEILTIKCQFAHDSQNHKNDDKCEYENVDIFWWKVNDRGWRGGNPGNTTPPKTAL